MAGVWDWICAFPQNTNPTNLVTHSLIHPFIAKRGWQCPCLERTTRTASSPQKQCWNLALILFFLWLCSLKLPGMFKRLWRYDRLKLTCMTHKLLATSSLHLYTLNMINTSWRTLKPPLCAIEWDSYKPHFLILIFAPSIFFKKKKKSMKSRNLGVSLVLFMWWRSVKASCLHGKTSEVSTHLFHTLWRIYTTFHPHVHLYVCAGQRSDWWNFAFFDVTVSLHSPLQPLGFLNKSDGFVCMLAGFRSILPQNQEFGPRMFWWKYNNIFNINNSDSVCFAHGWTDESPVCSAAFAESTHSFTADPDVL